MKTPPQALSAKEKFCQYCEHTGIVHNPHFNELGEHPLHPCPRCILTKCLCKGEDPYYIFINGKIEDCHCRATRMKIDRINLLYSESGINKKYRWKFLSDFKSINKDVETAKNAVYDIIKNFPNVRKGLFLWGPPGTGKTMLASIILTELMMRHAVEGRYVSISRNLFKSLQETFTEGSATYGGASKIEKELAEIDILVIDDFGVQKETQWKQETIYDLVDARYEAERFTIITSNISPLKGAGDITQNRIFSRVKEMCRIIEMNGPDFREKL